MASAAEVGDALSRLVVAAHRQRAAAATALPDVNATDLLALDIVRRTPGISPGALARALHLTPGGTNGVIRRTIQAGMMERRASPKDKRDVRLTVTDRGETTMTTGPGGWDAAFLEELAQLRGERWRDMIALFATIAEVAERRADEFAELAEERENAGTDLRRPVRWG